MSQIKIWHSSPQARTKRTAMRHGSGYELWDNRSANLIDWFDEEADALAYVRETVESCGPAAVAEWALDHLGVDEPPLSGAPLIARAMALPAPARRRSG